MCEGSKGCPLKEEPAEGDPDKVETMWNHWPEGAIKLHRGTGADCSAACAERARPGRDDPAVATITTLPR